MLRLLPLVPALATLALILTYASEVPHGDEWDTPGRVLVEIAKGTVTWHHFFKQHNESRKVLPRAVFTLGTLLFGWRVVPYMVLGWLLALTSLLLLLRMLAGDPRDEAGWVPFAGLLMALLLFSPVQAENQLWGIQMIVFIPPLCLVASLWVQSTKISYRSVVLLCALFSLVATFSFANGMLCWVLAFPLARYWLAEEKAAPRRSVQTWTAVYLGLAVATLAAYFWDYRRPPHHPSFHAVLEDPALGARFFTTWLGNPFAGALSGDADSASSLGTVFLVLLFLVSAWILRESGRLVPRRFWRPYYPWICITAYGILSGLTTTAGRAGFGHEQAFSGRYCTFALWVYIGLAGMAAVLWRSPAGRRSDFARVLCLLVGGTLCYLAMVSWRDGLERFGELGYRGNQHLLTLRLVKIAPDNPLIGCPGTECLLGKPKKVLQRTAILSKADWMRVDFVGPWLNESLASPAAGGRGEVRITTNGENRFRIVGWAALPGEPRAPDFVALARPVGAGKLELVSGLVMKDHLPPAALEGLSPRPAGLDHVLFSESLEMSSSDARDLRAFAVDLSRQLVYGPLEVSGLTTPSGGAGMGLEPLLAGQPDGVVDEVLVDRALVAAHPGAQAQKSEHRQAAAVARGAAAGVSA